MDNNQIREVIARRVALELKDNDVVNLGIGIPTWVPNYLKPGVHVVLQSENGMIGIGEDSCPGGGRSAFHQCRRSSRFARTGSGML